MLILLPPSESKTARSRGTATDPGSLSFPELAAQRRELSEALAAVSARPDAAELLGVSPNLVAEIARNTRLSTAPAVPVRRLYTGVLFDAMDLAGMDTGARRRATRRIVVVSALHGALRLGDAVAPYRMSIGARLPEVGPLAAFWRPHLGPVLTREAGSGVVVDCRSSGYAAAGRPTGPAAERWVQVQVPGASHHAKYTRGLVAGFLCRTDARVSSVEQLAATLAAAFDVRLSAPARAGAPWQLAVTPVPPSAVAATTG
ncbi:YaaA family protein [Georgenia sunbinii]|uniref:YaaA family protein n=1 Tax=Georgenia sunbinii TaxID=3117728 RepID=UPI002F25FD3E